jgi:uncharacterized SAM-binding protein YcdF (DUF218 family)
MFLFLSKLLPLLIYPLGLVSLLMVLCLILLWRRPVWASVCLVLALALLMLSSNSWTSTALVRSLEWRHLPPTDLPQADAIVVLGGSIKPATFPRPWVDLAEEGDRVLHGVRLYQAGKAPLIIFSGGRITWGSPNPRSEADDMAEVALALGVPAAAMVKEPRSLNTYENAREVKKILMDRRLDRVLLVTSALHMPRSLAIFKKQGITAIPAATDFHIVEDTLTLAQTTWQGNLLSWVPQTENLHYLTRALKEYVGLLVYRLKGWL